MTTRREFLRDGWKVGGALLAVAAGWTVYESLRPLSQTGAGGPLTLKAPGNYPDGTATYVVEGQLFITNAKGNLFALSQKCPHLGCHVPFCESSGRFECPCHGSIYDLAGEHIAGPAPRGMDRYDVKLDGQNVVVDTGVLQSGPARGTKNFLTAPKGPGCIGKA